MKKKLFLIFLLIQCLNSFAQDSLPDFVSKSSSQRLVLSSSLLKNRPFYKKSIFNFLKKPQKRYCEFNLTLDLNFVLLNDSVLVIIDDPLRNVAPVVKKFGRNSFSLSDLREHLYAGVEKLSNQEYCNQCVYNFINYYTAYLDDTTSVDTAIFTTSYMKDGVYVSESIVTPKKFDNISLVSSFPLNAGVGGTYVVLQGDSRISGNILYLPKNYTIKVDSSVKDLNWAFNKIIFEEGATIDLSHRDITYSKPATPPANINICNPLRCPTHGSVSERRSCSDGKFYYGNPGSHGREGLNGGWGLDGTNLTLKVNFIENTGSLWIRTDGGDGGDGGNGGDGGYGGWGECGGAWGHGTDGGNGGNGGLGGNGGWGGRTSVVRLVNSDNQIIQRAVPTTLNTPSVRPGQVTGSTGLIAIFGNHGKAGIGGFGGNGGERGHGCNCGSGPFNTSHSNDGSNGKDYRSVKANDGLEGVFRE